MPRASSKGVPGTFGEGIPLERFSNHSAVCPKIGHVRRTPPQRDAFGIGECFICQNLKFVPIVGLSLYLLYFLILTYHKYLKNKSFHFEQLNVK